MDTRAMVMAQARHVKMLLQRAEEDDLELSDDSLEYLQGAVEILAELMADMADGTLCVGMGRLRDCPSDGLAPELQNLIGG